MSPHCCTATLVGEGSKREKCHFSALGRLSVTSSTTHKQIGPFSCWFPGGWFCVCSRTLWVSPMNSFEKLGVSPVAPPTGFFSGRGFEALFPHAGTLGCLVCLSPQLFLPVYPHAIVGPASLPAATSPIPILQLQPCCKSSLPLLPVWMNVSSLTPWLSDFYTVWFSGRYGYFLFLNLLLFYFWLCEEAKCIYLCLHLGQKSHCYCSC